MSKFNGFTSRIVHHDRLKKFADGPVHAPIYNSVPYGYDRTEDLIDIFQGKVQGQSYARQSTPTMEVLNSLISELEGGLGTISFATGMAALSATMLALLKNGDHLITSKYLFGNTFSFFQTLTNYGIEVSFVDPTDVAEVKAAQQRNTRMVFVETIANPGTQIADLAAIGEWCDAEGLVYVVDNTITSPYLFQPKSVKASLVMNSLSKYVSGHGTVLGGAITECGNFDWSNYPNIFDAYRKGDSQKWSLQQIKKKALRDMGGSISSDASYQILVGAETMALRMDRSCASAAALAAALDAHPKVANVNHPSLPAHPQHKKAQEWFRHFGAIFSFDLQDGLDPVKLLNSIDLVINATHLGDNRTLALPVASTIFFEMGPENRARYGISETMVRCSVGIEETDELVAAFVAALDRL